MFDDSKVSFSVNNLFNSVNITDVSPCNGLVPVGNSAYYATPLSRLSIRPI